MPYAPDSMAYPIQPPMPGSRKRLYAAAVLVIAAALLLFGLRTLRNAVPAESQRATIGKALPSMTVYAQDGTPFDLSRAAAGQRRVIAFYSPVCDACKAEIPLLQAMTDGPELILVKIPAAETAGALKVTERPGRFFVDRDDVMSRQFPMSGVPLLLFVDERNVLRDGMIGAQSPSELRRRLQEFAVQQAGA